MGHWHNALVERKDGRDAVQLGVQLSSPALATREAEVERVSRLLNELGVAAAASVAEGLVAPDHSVRVQAWASAWRDLHLVECDGDCEATRRALWKRLAGAVEERTGKPVTAPQPPVVG